jgi:purine-nucleoside phosphorylase
MSYGSGIVSFPIRFFSLKPIHKLVDNALTETVDFLSARCGNQPVLGLILGSGFGSYADRLEDSAILPYSSIPHFPRSTVSGHPGNLVAGTAAGVPCVALQGRFHYYEGYSMTDIAFPVRVLGRLGIRCLIVTNAAGGLNPDFEPGDLMLIEDHINMMGSNPLIGYRSEDPNRHFPDLSRAYDPNLRTLAYAVARRDNIPLCSGIYIGVSGPCYETPAEVRMYRGFGADAIGMSTVPEVIVAAQAGIRVLGLSCITNKAAGPGAEKITHQEVLEATKKAAARICSLLDGIIKAVEGPMSNVKGPQSV